MAVRVLLMVMVLTLLYGCGQAGSPPENPEKQGDVERPKTVTPEGAGQQEMTQETTQQLEGNGIVREEPTGKQGIGCFARGYQQQATSNTKPNGKKIVFAAHPTLSSGDSSASADNSASPGATASSGDSDICVMNADGTGMRRLTSRASFETGPTWSPDGKQIAFESGLGIHVMNADGSHEVEIYKAGQISLGSDLAHTWSPDGREIAFGLGCAIYVIDADGSGTPRKFANESLCVSMPAWSPDGKKIAYGVGPEGALPRCIYSMTVSSGEADTNQRRQLTDCSNAGVSGIVWSPDGKEIAYVRVGDVGPGSDRPVIYKVDASSLKVTALRPALGHLGGQLSEPSWSPDGKQIAFAYSFEKEYDHNAIYKMNADGSNPVPVTDIPTMWAYSPDWQPLP